MTRSYSPREKVLTVGLSLFLFTATAVELIYQPIIQVSGRICLIQNCVFNDELEFPKDYDSLLAITRGNALRNNDREYPSGNTIDDVSEDQISPYFLDALLLSEDKRFYQHNGHDYFAIMRSLTRSRINLTDEGLSIEVNYGGSTLETQLLKLFFDNPYTSSAETRESRSTLASMLNVTFRDTYGDEAKDKILLSYLNSVDFGYGQVGIYEAATFYFGKLPSELSLAESVMLNVTLRSPPLYNPVTPELREDAQVYGFILLRDLFYAGNINHITEAQHEIMDQFYPSWDQQ